jgi:hypothetical protein
MNSWMKRRIHRSRVRCQKASPATKERMQREKAKGETNKQAATNSPATSYHTSDK